MIAAGSRGRDKPNRYLRVVGLFGFLILAAVTFLVAAFQPLYTDEVVWKLTQGRYFHDGGRTGIAFATCSAKSFYSPWLLTPFRIFDSFIYQDIAGPGAIRNIGVGLAIGCGGLIWLLLRRALPANVTNQFLLCLVVAFATLGAMPFLLVLNRPEQVLLIGTMLFALPVLLGSVSGRRPLVGDVGIAVWLMLFVGYFFSSHPRAVFGLPLALLFINHLFVRKKLAVAVGVAASVLCFVSLRDWGVRSKCDDPLISRGLALDSIQVAFAQGELFDFGLHLLWRLISNPAKFFYFSVPRLDNPAGETLIPPVVSLAAVLASGLTEAVLAVLVIAGAVAFLKLMGRAVRLRRITAREWVLVSLWGFYAFSLISRGTRNVYEAALMVPVMVVASLGSLWVARDLLEGWIGAVKLRWLGRWGFRTLIGASVISQMVVIGHYVPYAAGAWSVPGYIEGRRLSISAVGYDAVRPQILATARMCGIEPTQQSRHPILDELTVFAMQPVFQPVVALYIEEGGWGTGIQDYRAYLRNIGSAGMVVGCQWVPTQLRSSAIRNGAFCCVPAVGP